MALNSLIYVGVLFSHSVTHFLLVTYWFIRYIGCSL